MIYLNNMKKIILLIILVFTCFGLFGQNVFKYEVQANGGIRIGDAINIRIDSAIFNGTSIIFYSGGDTLSIYEPYANREVYEMLDLDSALADISTDLTTAILNVNIPESTGTVVAGTGITTDMLNFVMYFNTTAPINITAVPQIADGTDGQRITIVGSSDTNTLTLDDANGLQLVGGASCVLGSGDTIVLLYITTLDLWIEISRSNN